MNGGGHLGVAGILGGKQAADLFVGDGKKRLCVHGGFPFVNRFLAVLYGKKE